ncbi:MAG: DMT family transporter [Rhodospirillaceae bacterium]|jgi:drug/metabolite transporter (DMT)-like permease|nr:DMT family transporter [Rhodospirillaceae bacterium]MBT5941257.1 DMT family transporter [Rhodospirillaceae bacterium]MBT7265409.1 DMT family transporter [Rhodospirillaceae bacterium]
MPRDRSFFGISLVTIIPILMVALWGTAFTGTKLTLAYGEPFTLLFWRCAVTAAAMLAVSLAARASWPKDPRIIAWTACVGLFVHGIFLSGSYFAVDRGISTGLVALISALQPLLTAVLAIPILNERISVRQLMGLGVGLAGVALVVANKVSLDDDQMIGAAIAFLAPLGLTLGFLIQKRYALEVDLRTGMTIQFAAATAIFAILASGFESMEVRLTLEFLLVQGWLSFGVSAGAIAITYFMIRNDAIAKVSSLFYLVPPIVSITGYFLFGETFGILAIVGMVIALAGVMMVKRS